MCYLYKIVYILLLIVLVVGLTNVRHKKTKLRTYKNPLRIIGGTDAPNSKYPYIARLELWVTNGTQHWESDWCTCSILTPEWTLTAAHCVLTLHVPEYIRRMLRYMLRYGSDDPSVNASTAEVLKLIPHPAFRTKSLFGGILFSFNDIGLMKTSPITLQKYGRLSAVDFLSLSGEQALAFGFGLTIGNHTIASTLKLHKPLQALDVIIRRCSRDDFLFKKLVTDLTPVICLSHRCGVRGTNLPGDSGGPLLHESGIIGVASTTDGLRSKNVGKYTAVSPLLDWIGSTIGEK